MSFLDWLFVAIPLIAVVAIGEMARRYTRNVADFLAAGRQAGRYLISVADGTAGMGLISVVGIFEMQYKSGYALDFWNSFTVLITLALTLTGFMIYRYRETRVLTMAQFFEIRYSRGFRIFAGFLAFVSGVVNYALFPAVGSRFMIYYCGFPDYFSIGSLQVNTFGFLMALFLSIALFIVLSGGQITTMVTDCCQGIFGYLGYTVIVITILCIFSFSDIQTAVLSRPEGKSFFNPFNIDKLESFNLLYILIGMFGAVYNRNAWLGQQGYLCAAANPHEQKMAGVLGAWRAGFNNLMLMLLVIGAYTYMNAPVYADQAAAVTHELATRITPESVGGLEQTAVTLRHQMLVPVVLRHILPIGVTGLFCALALFLMVSTDTTYLHSWGTILVQDIILPIRNKPFKPKTQLLLLRLSIAGIAVFAWVFSFRFGQSTYILQFFALTGTVYLGGAGSCILGGLYWKKGTRQAAYTAMIVGMFFGILGFAVSSWWEGYFYPTLNVMAPQLLEEFRVLLYNAGESLPFVNWSVEPEVFRRQFPVSGQEIYLLGMLCAIGSYIAVSLLTCRKEFNLDKMLHRGKYNLEHFIDADADRNILEAEKHHRFNWRSLLGITAEYSRGDRILAWSVLIWILYGFSVCLVQLVWNLGFGIWSEKTWFNFWRCYSLPLALLVGAVTTVWFTWGATRDLRRLFRSLRNPGKASGTEADDGFVKHDRE